jgi:putative tryptophan/tyrosine transport system substrate-binding protein
MQSKSCFWLLLTVLLSTAFPADAQQTAKIPRIGYVGGVSLSANTGRHEAFRQGLRELHYVEGKNIVIDWRSADGKLERFPTLAAEMVRLKLDVIVTSGPTATRAFKEATHMIPIVMTNDPDPVGDGIIASLARPGGNITGLSVLAPELNGKRLEVLRELLKEIIPRLSHGVIPGPPVGSLAEDFFIQLRKPPKRSRS